MSDLLIVNPPTDNPYSNRAIEPPVWCAYLAAVHGGRILDAQEMTHFETKAKIGGCKALYVAMGSNPSASSTPKMPMIERLMQDGDSIAGLHPEAMKDPRRVTLPTAAQMAKLTPDWQDTDFTDYRAHNWHTLGQDPWGYGVIYTSFGCSFTCQFCNIHALYNSRKVQFRDPQAVFREVDMMVRKGVKHLKICDELFTLNSGHVDLICAGLKPYNLNIWAYARVGTVSSGMLARMKDAGINWLAIGFESADPVVRKLTQKKVSGGRTNDAIRMIREAGINIIGNFMFGLPGDTTESMQMTADWAEEQNFEYVNYYVALPYPGSDWYKSSRLNPHKWEDFSQFSVTKAADREVVRFRNQAFINYFARRRYEDIIEEKFGEKAKQEIRKMLEPVVNLE